MDWEDICWFVLLMIVGTMSVFTAVTTFATGAIFMGVIWSLIAAFNYVVAVFRLVSA